ncbi:hypothetical protein C7M84_019318 [Penaeus vannamei]|uniref:Uncharacterized protein n=1 Tax=Penaeus vannamei TaxID=6689 RepID=A0A3R7MIV1_PENVA|nr:hypothetical protein C7M84_019318 [Penaeus vannamei]
MAWNLPHPHPHPSTRSAARMIYGRPPDTRRHLCATNERRARSPLAPDQSAMSRVRQMKCGRAAGGDGGSLAQEITREFHDGGQTRSLPLSLSPPLSLVFLPSLAFLAFLIPFSRADDSTRGDLTPTCRRRRDLNATGSSDPYRTRAESLHGALIRVKYRVFAARVMMPATLEILGLMTWVTGPRNSLGNPHPPILLPTTPPILEPPHPPILLPTTPSNPRTPTFPYLLPTTPQSYTPTSSNPPIPQSYRKITGRESNARNPHYLPSVHLSLPSSLSSLPGFSFFKNPSNSSYLDLLQVPPFIQVPGSLARYRAEHRRDTLLSVTFLPTPLLIPPPAPFPSRKPLSSLPPFPHSTLLPHLFPNTPPTTISSSTPYLTPIPPANTPPRPTFPPQTHKPNTSTTPFPTSTPLVVPKVDSTKAVASISSSDIEVVTNKKIRHRAEPPHR